MANLCNFQGSNLHKFELQGSCVGKEVRFCDIPTLPKWFSHKIKRQENHETFTLCHRSLKRSPKISWQVPKLISNFCVFQERVACNVGGQNINTGDAKRVSPCTMCTCTKEGPLCQSLKVENCFHLAQSFTRSAILDDHVCKVQCAFAFRAFPNVRTGENRIGFS